MNDESRSTNETKDRVNSPSAIGRSSFFNSIRWHLQLWYGLILLVVLGGFGFTAFQLERGHVFRRLDDELQRRSTFLANMLRQPPRNRGPNGPPGGPPDGPPRDDENGPPDRGGFNDGGPPGPPMPKDFHPPSQLAEFFDQSDPNGYYYAIWRRNDTELTRSSNAPAGLVIPEREGIRMAPRGMPQPQVLRTRGTFREALIFTPPGEIILTGHSTVVESSELRYAAFWLSGVGAAIFVLGIFGGWWLASRAIRPIQAISATAAKISAGDLSQRINISETESELGRLASVLNSTFARLDAAFAQQRQFTSDAAHELRTPLAIMLTQAQTALNRERAAAEYRETLESCQRAAQRMRRLIESLLELARFDAGQQSMKQFRFDLAQTANDCVTLIGPLSEARHVKVTCDLPPLNCVGDSDRLSQVVTNLLTNAINYNKPDGEVRVTGAAKNGSVTLTVSDTGVGISTQDLPHVFDRFYRADKSRTSGHTGLGLAISKAIIEAHGGTIEVSSQLDIGTVFTLRLPSGAS